jgi:small GTP-binding protein
MFDVIVIGDVAVSKTSLIRCFTGAAFPNLHNVTVRIEFCLLSLVVRGAAYRVRIHDTPGEQQYRDFTRIQRRIADVIIFVYSVNDRDSFQSLPSWLETVSGCNMSQIPVAVVGNKKDLDREVAIEEGQQFVESRPRTWFYEASCLEGEGLDAVRYGIWDAIVAYREELYIPFKTRIDAPLLPNPPARWTLYKC